MTSPAEQNPFNDDYFQDLVFPPDSTHTDAMPPSVEVARVRNKKTFIAVTVLGGMLAQAGFGEPSALQQVDNTPPPDSIPPQGSV